MGTNSIFNIARADGSEDSAQALDLGDRVRSLRKARGWTLERAARQAGLARSTLSKIENGQMSPTYDALKKLATGLEISVPQLFTPPAKTNTDARFNFTRSTEGAGHVTATYEHELFAQDIDTKRMLPYRARIRARDAQEFNGWVRHNGEEFLYVLTGEIRLFTEFYQAVDMKRGDTAYYDATMGHNVISISREDATVLWVTTLD